MIPHRPALSPAPFDALLLDVDGTMYLFDQPYKAECTAAFQRSSRLNIASFINGQQAEAKAHIAAHGLHHFDTPHHLKSMLNKARMAMRADFIQPQPALVAALKNINVPIWASTNSEPEWLDKVLQKSGLSEVITAEKRICAPRDLRTAKHNAYGKIRELMGLPATSRILAIEDDARNLLAAERAGMHKGWITQDTRNTPPNYADFMGPTLQDIVKQAFPGSFRPALSSNTRTLKRVSHE